jgi:hypothetical protein
MIDTQDLDRRISRLENRIRNINDDLSSVFVLGRLRVDRTAPINSSDVNTLDLLYDVYIDETNIYYLINSSGTLEWRLIALSSF